MSCDLSASLCLRVTAEHDPGALARVLERFQNLNVFPRKVSCELASTGEVHIRVDVSGLSEEMLSLITGKVAQVPCILNAYWHYL